MSKTFDVFLSYAHQDGAAAKRLASELEEQGVSVWLDQAILPGDDWDLKVRETLEQSSNVVMLVSTNSLASQSTLYEMGLAVQHARKNPGVKLLPVLIGDVDDMELPAPLRSFNVIDSTRDREALEATSHEIVDIVTASKRR
jgi:hypothetical protein